MVGGVFILILLGYCLQNVWGDFEAILPFLFYFIVLNPASLSEYGLVCTLLVKEDLMTIFKANFITQFRNR